MLVPLLRYRRFILHRALADVRHRYAGTGMGVVWNVLHPLALIAIYSVVFTRLMNRQLAGQEQFAYTLYLCSGFLPWLAFCECVTRGAGAFVDNAAYLRKLPVPEQVFVASSAAAATLSLAISFTLLLGLSLALGRWPTWHWLLLPLPLAALQAMGFGLGLLAGTLNVFFRDVGQLLTVVLQILMWTVPIVYPVTILPAVARGALTWHPLMPPLAAIRDLFLYGTLPPAGVWAGVASWPVVAIVLGGAVFRVLAAEIRDCL